MQLLHLGHGRHLGRFPVGLARACLTSLSFAILDTRRTHVVVFSELGEVVRHSGLNEFHSWALCRECHTRGVTKGT